MMNFLVNYRQIKKPADGNDDFKFMQRALALAQKGMGAVSPNPMVGAVIVKNGQIIGEGYHRKFGGDHAEVMAIKNARENIRGATMYVTLEPCCFYGKTPPCVDRLIAEGIQKVVIGTVDPDPRVNQKGIQTLLTHGIEVGFSCLEVACRELLTAYTHHRLTGVPFTTIKVAQTLDGQIATNTGNSQWISSLASRKFAHLLRKQHDAVLVGTGTAVKDDPQLNLRHVRGINPQRIVLDSQLRTPIEARLFHAEDIEKTIVVTSEFAPQKKLEQLQQKGVQVIFSPLNNSGFIDLPQLWKVLAGNGITSLLVEGGGQLITSIFQQRLANRLIAVIAPMLLGQGVPYVGDLGLTRIDQAIHLTNLRRIIKARDTLIIGDVEYPLT
jgi:diaminohydroxyphosphoribosylaminopyrimidine deaminase/5-amino-6-(5-phosphoribosylamino)uracil reductase